MAYVELHLYSNALGMQTTVGVILPQQNTAGEIGINGKQSADAYKTLYLLHGLSDDYSIWLRRTSIERYATKYGICVVMPCAGKSFYFNQQNGENYYDYIAKELPARMEEFFHVSKKREDRFITGNSMGGYGALKIAMKEPHVFAAAAGLSSVANIRNVLWKERLEGLLGKENYLPDDHDLFTLASGLAQADVKPRLYMWCGTGDYLYQDNLALRDHIRGLDLEYVYEESEGTHCWECWDVQIQRVLQWMFGE